MSKCQLVGYRNSSFTKKDTNQIVNSLTLHFVREPSKITESDVVGNVSVSVTLYDSQINALPKLEINKMYECEFQTVNYRAHLVSMV